MKLLWVVLLFALTCLLEASIASEVIVRRVGNLPEPSYWWWVVSTDGKRVYAMGARAQVNSQRRDMFTVDVDAKPPYLALEIDPAVEQTVAKHLLQEPFPPFHNAQYIRASLGDDLVWLTRDHDFWQVANGRIYALLPLQRDPDVYPARWRTIHEMDATTRQVVRSVDVRNVLPKGDASIDVERSQYIITMQTSPDGRRLLTGHSGLIMVWSLPDLQPLFYKPYNSDREITAIELSADGRLLYALACARGLLVLNLQSRELERWDPKSQPGTPQKFGIEDLHMVDMALAPDGREIFFALRYVHVKGAVAALDTSSRKITRILRLGPTACISLCVVGNKLFAACLDGIYVIDIDAWRKNPNYQPPWVKEEK